MAGHTFHIRCIVFHLSTRPPLFQIQPSASIVRHTFCNSFATPLLSMKVLWTKILIAGGDNLFKRLRSKDLKDGYGATSGDKTPTFRSLMCGVLCESCRSGFLQKATVV